MLDARQLMSVRAGVLGGVAGAPVALATGAGSNDLQLLRRHLSPPSILITQATPRPSGHRGPTKPLPPSASQGGSSAHTLFSEAAEPAPGLPLLPEPSLLPRHPHFRLATLD